MGDGKPRQQVFAVLLGRSCSVKALGYCDVAEQVGISQIPGTLKHMTSQVEVSILLGKSTSQKGTHDFGEPNQVRNETELLQHLGPQGDCLFRSLQGSRNWCYGFRSFGSAELNP